MARWRDLQLVLAITPIVRVSENDLKEQTNKIMWNTNTLWFDTSIVTLFFLFGHIFFSHFEERSPKWRKVAKYIVTMVIMLSISGFAGRVYAFSLLGLAVLPVIYVHAVLLPRKGINGWTGEPKSKYYDFRGWDKNIFNG